MSGIRKAIACATSCAGVIATQYATNGTVQHWTTIAIAILGFAGTYLVPNTPQDKGKHEA